MFNIFKKNKKENKFNELFVRIRHKRYGEGFIVAYSSNKLRPIGVRFDNYNSALGSLCPQFIIRGHESLGNSEWFDEEDIEEVLDFNYRDFVFDISELIKNK